MSYPSMFFENIVSLLKKNSKIVLAFSGGLDSTVLLHCLYLCTKKYPESNIRAIHVNHSLNENSNNWANHCREICFKWEIDCRILNVKIKKNPKQGIEANARKERYNALISSLQNQEVLLTAHHLDDQCETLLLALKRGSGPAGLSAIHSSIVVGKNKILRPFLEFSRKSIEEYAKKHDLTWIEDDSNSNINFDRNFLRHSVLPKILYKWPNFTKTVSRSCLLCKEQERLIDELLLNQLNNLIQNNGSLYLIPLLKMSNIKIYALLRRWISRRGELMPSYKLLKLIYHKIILGTDAKPCLQIGRYEIRRYCHYLYCLPIIKSSIKNIKMIWPNINNILLLPEKLGFLQADYNNNSLRLPMSHELVSIQFYARGDFYLVGYKNKLKIKKIWQKFNIPPWERNRIPLIYYNDNLISAVNLFITNDGLIPNNKYGWQVLWNKK
ncbi:tRNA lysidine(34) synthetase TilS [Candidatus Pantoea edessiphila]|nr:tRNA lysidine(34) synthetase TilS [Candidatus Pantoea edessiphila]